MRITLEFSIAVLLIALIGAGSAGCQDSEPVPFAITWNYDTSGYLETCGCSRHQLGGIARRATLLKQLRAKQPVLAIEGAHIVEEAGEYQLFKGETIVRGLNLMDYSAMQLGVREAQQGREGLTRLSELAEFPLFSANLVIDGEPWATAYTIVEIAGTRVGITGVSQPELLGFELPEGVSFAEPKAALDSALREQAGRVDFRVVCLEGSGAWLSATWQLFSGQADLFFSGDREETSATLNYQAGPPRLNNWEMGKYLGLIMVDPLADGGFHFSGQNIELDDEIIDDEAVAAMLDNDYRAKLKDMFFSQIKVDLEEIYLPPEYCQDCHPDAYEAYTASGHSNALMSLYDKGQLYNPDCMRCHVSYDPDNDELVSLNCVTCHSNITEDHVWDALDDPSKIVPPDPPVTSYTFNYCYQCHDELNSANFSDHWPNYVERIYHGGDKTAAEQQAELKGLILDGELPEH